MKRPAEDPPDDPRLEPLPQTSIPSSTQAVPVQIRGTKRTATEAEVTADDMETEVTNLLLAQRTGFLGAVQGQEMPVCEDFTPEVPIPYWDEISGKPLDEDKIKGARKEEIHVVNQMGVWEPILRPYNERVISTRWIDMNKGDEERPEHRSRSVARELKPRGSKSQVDSTSRNDFFASMPHISFAYFVHTCSRTTISQLGWEVGFKVSGYTFDFHCRQESTFLESSQEAIAG